VALPDNYERLKIRCFAGRTGGRVVTVFACSSRLVAHKYTERTAAVRLEQDSAVGVKRGHSHSPSITRKAYESGAPSHLVPYSA